MSAVYSLYGKIGSGKSTFPFTMPGKKFVFDLERGANRATWRFEPEDYTLWTPNDKVSLDDIMISKGYRSHGKRARLAKILEKYIEVINDDEHQVIVFDSYKLMWDAITDGYLEELQDIQWQEATDKSPHMNQDQLAASMRWRERLTQLDYGKPNSRSRQLIDASKIVNKNLVLIHHITDEHGRELINGNWVNVVVGKKLDGFRHTNGIADWVIYTYNDVVVPTNGKAPEAKVPVLYGFIEKAPVGVDLMGQTMAMPSYGQLELRVMALGRTMI